jgi:RNA polymerase sigma factor (sigma-70 family)
MLGRNHLGRRDYFLPLAGAGMDSDDRERLEQLLTPIVDEEIHSKFSSGNPHRVSEEWVCAARWVFFNRLFDDEIPGVANADPRDPNEVPGYVRRFLAVLKLDRHEELLEAYRAIKLASETAYNAFYNKFYPWAMAQARSLLWSMSSPKSDVRSKLDEEAHDCVTHLFVPAKSPLKNYKAQASVKRLLFVSVVHSVYERLSKPQLATQQIEPIIVDPKPDPPMVMHAKRLYQTLRESVQSLPRAEHELLYEYFREGRKLRELATARGTSIAKMSRSISRVCVKLQKLLEKRDFKVADMRLLLEESEDW